MADLILLNANVITMDQALPRAKAVGIRDGIILEAAPDGRLSIAPSADAQSIDCKGKTVLPGFIDGHCHVVSFAESFMILDVSPGAGVTSIRDLQARLHAFAGAAPKGRWIKGKGYDEFRLAEGRHPNRWELDVAVPDHPVKLTHRSGHAHALNSGALKAVGITAETGDPPGGIIERDLKTGEPTGLLFAMAAFLHDKIPSMSASEVEEGMGLANGKFLSYGITSVQDASSHNGPDQWERFADWIDRGILQPRVTMMRGAEHFAAIDGRLGPAYEKGGERLSLGGVKIVIDRTTGALTPDQETLNTLVAGIHGAGQQAVIHAVEEETLEAACAAIEHALAKAPRADHRHRIEHCSVCPPVLLDRIRRLGITVVSQPPFVFESGDRYLATVERDAREYLYRFGAMVKAGIALAGSSDCPVANPDPLIGICAAVTRRTKGGNLLLPSEALSPAEAIRMYTIGAATAAREEEMKGSISPGKVADLVVLSGDPCAEVAEKIRDIRVETTVLGGEVVWMRPPA